jgi:hypothetical protein
VSRLPNIVVIMASDAYMSGQYPDLAGVPGVTCTQARNRWGYLSPNPVAQAHPACRRGALASRRRLQKALSPRA